MKPQGIGLLRLVEPCFWHPPYQGSPNRCVTSYAIPRIHDVPKLALQHAAGKTQHHNLPKSFHSFTLLQPLCHTPTPSIHHHQPHQPHILHLPNGAALAPPPRMALLQAFLKDLQLRLRLLRVLRLDFGDLQLLTQALELQVLLTQRALTTSEVEGGWGMTRMADGGGNCS